MALESVIYDGDNEGVSGRAFVPSDRHDWTPERQDPRFGSGNPASLNGSLPGADS